MTTDRSYTSNSIAPTESAAEYAHRVLGAPHPDEDTDRLQHEAELARLDGIARDLNRQIVDLTAYLDELHDQPHRRETPEFDRYVDHLDDLRTELDQLYTTIACHLGG